MKKIYIIIGLVIAIVIVMLVLIVQTILKNRNTSTTTTSQQNGTSIPTLFPNELQREASSSSTLPVPSGAPRVISSEPTDLEQNVPITERELTIDFSLPIDQQDLVIYFEPDIDNAFVVSKNKLLLRFIEPLQRSTIYSYTVESQSKGILYTGSFTTEGPLPTALPDTRPEGFFEAQNEYYLQNNPDVFLSNKLPYEGQTFSMAYILAIEPERYEFTVTTKGTSQEQARQDAINWMKSLGLQDSQISGLLITYN